MDTFNWSCFTLRININAPFEKIYWCWTTREGMEYWFLRMSEFIREAEVVLPCETHVQQGDTYRWRWFGYPDEVTETGNILEANGKDRFAFSFGNAGNCRVHLKTEKGENIVELIQEDIPTTEQGMHYWHLGCKTGWTFYLANLKSLLEGGIDLRNKNDQLNQMLNA